MREGVWVFLGVLSVCSALICPDGGMCDDGNTCCETPSGGYGCCPLPNAECCSDHLHCCYEGTLCDLAHSKCINKTHTLDWVKRVAIKQSSLPRAVVCPDQKSECPDDTTCCQLPDESWGCCPMPIVCPSLVLEGWCPAQFDGYPPQTHSLNLTINWRGEPDVSEQGNYQNVLDHDPPGPELDTPDLDDFLQAVCCEDKRHCCPHGTTCDLTHSMCVSSMLGSSPLREKFPARRRAQGQRWTDASIKKLSDSNDVDCPDKVSRCPDGTTCCLLGKGTYGCCPMPNAVCCSDLVHCCPEGTSCDLIHGTCVSANEVKAMATKIPPLLHSKVTDPVPCNESVACESGSTCCKKKDGNWACCPLPEAVCCEDHVHCCPQGTVCDLAEGTCDDPVDPLMSISWIEKVPVFQRALQPPNQKCDSTSSCPKGTTCCKMQSGAWGCCPLPQAVCCEDHLHCCPHNTVCNVAAGTCDSGSDAGIYLAVPWFSKMPATTLPPQNNQCDETSVCPTGTTCCRQKSGSWACCPLPQAVCCDDHEHCCPQGYKCDVAHESCEHPFLSSMQWLRKEPALLSVTQHYDAKAESAVAGPEHKRKCDSQSSCPIDNTCCYMKKLDKWGCCPLPKAVCCGDGDHCCPNGYTCHTEKPTCIKGHLEIPWFRKQEAKVNQEPEVMHGVTNVKCDPTTTCPTGFTCCKLSTGQWGCCPHIRAVCCEDRLHCCPEGYSCDMQAGTCIKSSAPHTVPLMVVHMNLGEEVRCDATSHCSKTQSCCKLSDTDWACCPFKEAVCCKDMKHCCPKGYVCDPKAKGCTRVSSLTWWDNSL